jgi:hypothetical protein
MTNPKQLGLLVSEFILFERGREGGLLFEGLGEIRVAGHSTVVQGAAATLTCPASQKRLLSSSTYSNLKAQRKKILMISLVCLRPKQAKSCAGGRN